jgi:hypothetical protein
MPAYTVKEGAAAIIAGQEHDGPGSVVVLSEEAAAQPVALGHIEIHQCHRLAMAPENASGLPPVAPDQPVD